MHDSENQKIRKKIKLVSARCDDRDPVFLHSAYLNLSGQKKQQHKTCGYKRRLY